MEDSESFNVFYLFVLVVIFTNLPDKKWENWKFLFDLGLEHFDAENIDIALKQHLQSPFVAIILIISLFSFH